jgi:REP element-mobilizing transposase RayT
MDKTGRKHRIHTPNTIHHVMIRGNNRQRIFYGDDHFYYFLELLQQSAKKFDHKIIAYCLMTNHVHLLIHIHESPLSLIMKNINFRYARWLNLKLKRIGHLFQGRYRSLEVNDDDYLINLCRYIHFNPVDAKIVTCVENYPWSSHGYYVGREATWINTHLMCEAIRQKTNLGYLEFINGPVNREIWKPALTISETGKIIYDKEMIREKNEDTISLKVIGKYLTQVQVSIIVCNYLNIQMSDLIGIPRNRRYSKERILLASYLLRYSNINLRGIASLFHRTHGTLSRQLAKYNLHPEKYFSTAFLKNIENELNNAAMIKK